MNISFEKKRVLITGAGRGIGKDLAKAFVRCKAEYVYALSRTYSQLEMLVEQEPSVIPVCVDLLNWEATRVAVESLGPIDILVNNAGVFIGESFLDVNPDSFDKQLTINLKSVFNVSQVVAKGMVNRKSGGAIVNISSQASQMALRNHAVYCATKGAIDSLTGVMALELGEHGIRVNAVNPTVVLTDMGRATWSPENPNSKQMLDRMPLHKFAEVEDVVNAVLFLTSDKAAMITATKLPVDGGILAT